jgi:hypothetical protein
MANSGRPVRFVSERSWRVASRKFDHSNGRGACGSGEEECAEYDRSYRNGSFKPGTAVTEDEYMAHENALIAQWIALLDAFASLPAHRLQAIVNMLEHHTDQLASVLRPTLLLPPLEE